MTEVCRWGKCVLSKRPCQNIHRKHYVDQRIERHMKCIHQRPDEGHLPKRDSRPGASASRGYLPSSSSIKEEGARSGPGDFIQVLATAPFSPNKSDCGT